MPKVQPEAFLTVESAMIRTLTTPWKKAYNKWFKEVSSALRDGDYSTARALTSEFDSEGVFESRKKTLRKLTVASMGFGASRLTDTPDKWLSDLQAVDDSLELLRSMVMMSDRQVELAMLQAVDLIEAEGLLRQKAEPSLLLDPVSFAKEKGQGAGLNSVQMTASLHNGRLASYGFLVQAKAFGVDTYVLNAILDGRTSDICQELNGKEFPVQPAYDYVNEVLVLREADDLKAKAPFVDGSREGIERLQGMSTEQLMEAGIMTPPFHPYCRTYIDIKRSGGSSTIVIETPQATQPGNTEIDGTLTPQNVYSELYTQMGLDPDLVNALKPNLFPGIAGGSLAKAVLDAKGKDLAKTIDELDIKGSPIGGMSDLGIKTGTNFLPEFNDFDITEVFKAIEDGVAKVETMDRLGISAAQYDRIVDLLELLGLS